MDEKTEPDHEELQRLLTLVQDGVVSRAQLIELGYGAHDVRRMVRRRELTPVHPGVFVNHSGTLTWDQRAWAAVLVTGGVLCRESALPKPATHLPIQVAVDRDRKVRTRRDVRVHRTTRLEDRIEPLHLPPRVRPADAAIEVADSAADEHTAYRVLADVLHSRTVSCTDLREAMARCPRLHRRALLAELVDDLESGSRSVLERIFARDVELAHGLPRGRRQVRGRVEGRAVERDVAYDEWEVYVELDGHGFHSSPADRDRDLSRDLAAATEGHVTLRIGYRQALARACETATALARVLQHRGWTGDLTPCPRCSA